LPSRSYFLGCWQKFNARIWVKAHQVENFDFSSLVFIVPDDRLTGPQVKERRFAIYSIWPVTFFVLAKPLY
jgi:hypothetical protein